LKYVLDTNAVSALMKGDVTVLDRLRSVGRNDVAIPQPVLAEIAYGIERLPRSKRKSRLRERYRLIRTELQRLPWTDEVSDEFGVIKAVLERRGQRIEDFEAAIAAHALAAGAVLVTSNREHMARIADLEIEQWGILPSG
jgi:tRNA(fMet)-specific endonuclease VapC